MAKMRHKMAKMRILMASSPRPIEQECTPNSACLSSLRWLHLSVKVKEVCVRERGAMPIQMAKSVVKQVAIFWWLKCIRIYFMKDALIVPIGIKTMVPAQRMEVCIEGV